MAIVGAAGMILLKTYPTNTIKGGMMEKIKKIEDLFQMISEATGNKIETSTTKTKDGRIKQYSIVCGPGRNVKK